MKTLRLMLCFFSAVTLARAINSTTGGYTTLPVTVTGSGFAIDLSFQWSCDDSPESSAPGRLELYDASGNFVGRIIGSVYRGSGSSLIVSGPGSYSNVAYFMIRYAADGTPADGELDATWNITGLIPGTYTLRLWGYTTNVVGMHATTVWTSAVYLGGSTSPSVNSAPSIAWTSTPGTVGNAQTYAISAHGNDSDGNLSQVNIWKNGQPFAFAGGGNGTDGDSTNPSSDTGPQTITFTAQAVDTTGATSPVITQTVTVNPPPPMQFSLTTSAGPGGAVSAGGTYDAGTVAYISATPDGTHDFAGWSGDAGGATNPLGLAMDGNKNVTATFSPKLIPLTTSASAGGSVTPGGSYPYGTNITISAIPDATHTFLGWAGDASGSASSILLTVTSPLNVQAVFSSKTAQTITFLSPGNQPAGGPAFSLAGSSSSGLPVIYTVLTGPATLSSNQLQITGPGTITVQASQPGDALYLPAASVMRTFNAVIAAVLKYRPAGRTYLQANAANGTAPFVLEKP